MPLATLDSVSLRFGNSFALKKVSFEILSGECLFLTGSNGAGKSTLLLCLASILRPTSGRIVFDAAASVGLVPQDTLLYANLTIHENLCLIENLLGKRAVRGQREELLERFSLRAYSHKRIQHCSQGVQKRVSIVRALLGNPRLLLLDEAFSNLDDTSQQELSGVLKAHIADGRSVVLVTHQRELLTKHAGRELTLKDGRLERIPDISSEMEES